MEEEPKIRSFGKKDLREIRRIEMLSFSDPWSKDMFLALAQIAPEGFYVAEKNDRTIGFAIALIEPYFGDTEIQKRAHLINFAVHPEHRRKGNGKFIMTRVIEDAKKQKAQTIYLEVRRSNETALAFYFHLDFLRIGSIKDFYKDEDAIVLSKKI